MDFQNLDPLVCGSNVFFFLFRKAVVSFNARDSDVNQVIGVRNFCMAIPGSIKMPVYRAVKLRQLNLPLRIRTVPYVEKQFSS